MDEEPVEGGEEEDEVEVVVQRGEVVLEGEEVLEGRMTIVSHVVEMLKEAAGVGVELVEAAIKMGRFIIFLGDHFLTFCNGAGHGGRSQEVSTPAMEWR